MKIKKGYVPELRFPEFRNDTEWDVVTVGSKATKVGSGITPKGGDKNYKKEGRPFIRSQNIGWGHLVLDDVTFINDDTHSTFSSTEIKANDVLLNITGASIGRSAIADNSIQGGNVNQHVCIIRTKKSELKPYFLNQYLLSSDGQKKIDSFQAGGNRQGLNFTQIRSFTLLLPSIKEQQKIADCLSSLDKLILLQAKKIFALQQYKMGLMQKLFPAEGETVPTLRFAEFQKSWTLKEVGEIFKVTRGNVLSMELVQEYKTNENPYPVYSSQTKNRGVSGFYSTFLYEDAITWTTDGANAGDVNYRAGKFYCTNVCGVLISKDGHANICIAEMLNRISRKHVSYIGNPKLMNGVMKKIVLSIPSVAEQKKISNCLSSINSLISMESQKLAVLKNHKTGLIQQLFPAMDEVNG